MEQVHIAEIETIVTYDVYRKYYMFGLFRGKWYKYGPRLFIIISIIGLSASLYSGFAFGFDTPTKIFLSILVTLALLMAYLMAYVPKKYYNTARKLLEIPTKYKFADEYMNVESKGKTASSSSQINYDALYRIYELEDMLYIFISNTQAYIIPKRELSAEALQKLRGILQAKLGKKYIKYSK